MRWNPCEYLRFADERARPFFDLMARVDAREPAYVVDLGCGPGNLTRTLAQRWPGAEILGVDSSPDMVEQARSDAPEATYVVADLRGWHPARPVDVLVSNATLQWVPGHLDVLPRLVQMLTPGGWLAFQVPGNFGEPSHTQLRDLAASARWRPVLEPHDLPVPSVAEPDIYLDHLTLLGVRADVWETTYLQVLPGDDAVLRWMQGTGLRPVLSVLTGDDPAEFLAEYGQRLRAAYPQRSYGTVLPYRRIFAVAQAP